MNPSLAAKLPIDPADANTWLNVQPAWMPEYLDGGEKVIGWKSITERTGGVNFRTGYLVITEKTILQTDVEGMGVRVSVLHPYAGR